MKTRPILLLSVLGHIFCFGTSSAPRSDFNGVELFDVPAAFEVESTVQLNAPARPDREVGYRLRARLQLAPLWARPPREYLLQFDLLEPTLHLRGKHPNANYRPHPSVWDSHGRSTFYAHWKSGLIETAYLDSSDIPDIMNYKKSLISLFQFQISNGEHNETDVSGECNVLYETISPDVFRKIKRVCADDASLRLASGGLPVEGDKSGARRLARYSRGPRGLRAAHAEDVVALGPPALGLKARAWHSLQAADGPSAAPPRAAPPKAASLEAALAGLPPSHEAAPLEMTADLSPDDDEPTLEQAVEQHRAELAAGGAAGAGGAEGGGAGAGGGGARLAAALLRLLPAARAAPEAAALALLTDPDNHDIMEPLCGVLGLAGTPGAWRAARRALQLAAADPPPPWRAFLAAAARAPRPRADVARGLARLAAEARHEPLAAAAAQAAAAQARALGAAHPGLGAALRDQLAAALGRCRSGACRAGLLRALGVLGAPDAADTLLQHAERAALGAQLAALHALHVLHALLEPRRLRPPVLHHQRRMRLQSLALNPGPLEVRAAALDLAMRAAAHRPAALAGLASALRGAPSELRRVYWQRLARMGAAAGGGWDARAAGGTSSVLRLAVGGGAGGNGTLDAVSLAAGGVLRRALLHLTAGPHQILALDLWTTGLHHLAGGDAAAAAGEGGDDEPVAAGLVLWAGGAPLPPITLFESQAELLGLVWSGAGSEPTPVLRALMVLGGPSAAGEPGGAEGPGEPSVRLVCGVTLRGRWEVGAALAMDAQAQVSLWSRSARGRLQLGAGGAGAARGAVRTAWGRLGGRAELRAQPALQVAADLDFYGTSALCVRVAIDHHDEEGSIELWSSQGGRRLAVRRQTRWARSVPGRSLALGAPNDLTCRTLGGDL